MPGRGVHQSSTGELDGSLSFTSNVLDEGTTFIFGSWICVANGLGGFINHLVDPRKPEASAATQRCNLDSFIDDLDKLLLPDLPRQIEKTSVLMRIQFMLHQDYSDWTRTNLRRLHDPSPSPTWRRTWIASSRLEMTEQQRVGAPRSRLRLGFQRRMGHLAGVHPRLLGLHHRQGGGFNYHLTEIRGLTTSASASCRDIDELAKDLGEI
jgi:hypothetical protein